MEMWDEVVQEYNNELNRLQNIIGHGSAENYSNYRELVGRVNGIEWCRENFTTIVKKRLYEEEE
jgi:hypothetical protein